MLINGSKLTDLPEGSELVWPYMGVGSLKIFDRVDNPLPYAFGSGIVIGERHLLTVAHNLWDNKKAREFAYVTLQAGRVFTRSAQWFFPQKVRELEAGENIPIEHDYGVIAFLDKPFSQEQIVDRVFVADANLFACDDTTLIPGWRDVIDPGRRYNFERRLAEAPPGSIYTATEELLYKISTVEGMSGCPVLWRENDENRYVAVGLHASDCPDSKVLNRGVRLTKKVLDQINGWMKEEVRPVRPCPPP